MEALANCDLDAYDDSDRLSALADAISAWSPASPSVAHWCQAKFPNVLVRHFQGLVLWLHRWNDNVKKVLQVAGVTDADRRSILIGGAETAGVTLGSAALFGIAALLAKSLESSEALSVLQWYLLRLNGSIIDAGTNELDPQDLPGNIDGAVGRFLFSLLSDIDTRIRWRAAHVIRRLARTGGAAVIEATFSNYDRKADPTFRDPSAPYYWIAARLWAVIAVARIADETPAVVLPLAGKLQDIALDKHFPHVLIREHAKAAVLQLVKSGHLSLSADALVSVENVNTSKLARQTRADRISSNPFHDNKERRFHFDTLDAAQYWFNPIFLIFANLPTDDFYHRLEHWTVDEWRGAMPEIG